MAVNTTDSVFKESKKKETDLAVEALKNSKLAQGEKKVKFKCEAIYSTLYPNGFESTYQGVHIYLIFDGREVELSEGVANFVKSKIEKKTMSSLNKKARNTTKAQEYLGMEYVS